MWWGDGGMPTWGWAWIGMGWLTMVLFWGAVIWTVVWVVRRTTGGPQAGPGERPSALEIVRERYARGEISRDEFEQLRGDLAP
jgi:putative membrane protein